MSEQSQPARSPLSRFLLVLIPLALMLGSFVWIAALDPLRGFNNSAPPVEALPVIADYVWSAEKLPAGTIALTGYVPTEGLRRVLAIRAGGGVGPPTVEANLHGSIGGFGELQRVVNPPGNLRVIPDRVRDPAGPGRLDQRVIAERCADLLHLR